MRTRFIHILLFLMAAGWLFASCSSDVPNDENVTPGSEMQFAVSDVSRSSVLANLNYAGSRFAVFGDMKSSTSTSFVIFNGEKVSYDADNSKWTYANTRYWFPEHEHSFVAVHPAETGGASNTVYSNNSLSFDYVLPEAFGDTPDLLVATHRRVHENGATPTVKFNFVHAMSRLDFLVKCDGAAEKLMVNEIKLDKMYKSGTLTVNPASLTSDSKQTDDYEFVWTGSRKDETLTAGIKVEIADGSELPLFPDTNALFVIPQPDNKNIVLEINYTLYFKNGKTKERSATAETPIGGWLPGKVYTYSLAFTADDEPIQINVTVNDWKVGSTGDVQVPRK